MQDSEVSRIAKELELGLTDVARLGKIADKIMADKSNDHVVKFEDCDQVHNGEGY